ncbi:OsmC family protein [Natrialba sp. SSL1]|uniref:OsmC family protein n=1 Tax=Natrialba sp. SSL1 TaxID=1869245 RepID=UPI0008F8F1E8|nr:OsmC family protein [Natrialba sp. SSL1]OIB59149.1 osmotically inducible protein OsmC [Natrialba sp. SSL1]
MGTNTNQRRPTRATTGIDHGVDTAAHADFIDWLAANPTDGMLEFRATGASESVTNRTTATIGMWELGGEEMGGDREHTLEFGLPPELEDAMGYLEPTDRYEAIEGALAALTACINGTIGYNAIREGIAIEDVTTTVRAPVDLRMLFGIHDLDRADEMYGELEIEVDVTGDLTAEEQAAVQAYPQRSPVYTLITLAQPNTPTVEVRSPA